MSKLTVQQMVKMSITVQQMAKKSQQALELIEDLFENGIYEVQINRAGGNPRVFIMGERSKFKQDTSDFTVDAKDKTLNYVDGNVTFSIDMEA